MAQARFHQGKGDAGVHGLPPAEAHALHQHAGDLGHVGVGVGIGRAPAHHHQQGVVQGDGSLLVGLLEGVANAGPSRLDHLQIHPQLPAVIHPQASLGGVGVEYGGDVVLGVAGGEQHRRNRQDVPHPALAQGLQPIPQDRAGELQVAVLHRQGSEALAQGRRQLGELLNRQAVAAAVAAHQHADRPMLPVQRSGRC